MTPAAADDWGVASVAPLAPSAPAPSGGDPWGVQGGAETPPKAWNVYEKGQWVGMTLDPSLVGPGQTLEPAAPVPPEQPRQPPGPAPAPAPAPSPEVAAGTAPVPVMPGAVAPPPAAPVPAEPPPPPVFATGPPMEPAPTPMPLQPLPPSAPQPPPSWAHTGGVAATRFLEGAARAASLPLDLAHWIDRNVTPVQWAAQAMGVQPPSWLTVPQTPSMSDTISTAVQRWGAQPQTQGERLLGDVSGGVGSVAGGFGLGGVARLGAGTVANLGRFLQAAPAIQTAGGVGAGVASNVGQQARLSPGQQAALELAGGLGGAGLAGAAGGALRSGGAFLRSLTPAGRRQMAAELLLRQSSDPATLQARIAAGAQAPRLPGAPVTTAMAAQDPALLVREQALRSQPGGLGIRAVEARRGQRVAETLGNLAVAPAMTPGQRGQVVRRVLAGQEREMNARTDQLYERARQATGNFPTDPMRNAMVATSRKFYGPGGGPAPAAFRGIVQQINDQGRTASAEWLMNMDRQIGNEIGIANAAGDKRLASALGELRDAVGSINPTAEYAAARAYRARVGEVMGRDVAGAKATGDISRVDRYGRPMLADEAVAARAVRDPGSVRQVLRAGDEAIAAARARGAAAGEITRLQGEAAAARSVLRDQFLENAEQRARLSGDTISLDAAGQPQANASYSPAQWRRFWDQNEETAGLLFNAGERRTLGQLTEQMAETAAADRTAAAKGSPTAQNLAFAGDSPTVAHIFTAMTRGRIDPDSVAGRLLFQATGRLAAAGIGAKILGPLGGMGFFLPPSRAGGILFGTADEAVRAILHDAMADPQFARELLARATPDTLARVLRHAQGYGWLGELARRSAARGVIQQEAKAPQTGTPARPALPPSPSLPRR